MESLYIPQDSMAVSSVMLMKFSFIILCH